MNDKVIQVGDKSYKQCEVVMLPTERDIPCKNSIIKSNITNNLNIFDPHGIGFLNKDRNQVMQHLYILSSEEIKEGDWLYNESMRVINQRIKGTTLNDYSGYGHLKKIIATTDELPLNDCTTPWTMEHKYVPRPSDDFIKAFVKAQGKIDKVLVEYEKIWKNDEECPIGVGQYFDGYKLKIAKDNSITIKPIEKAQEDLLWEEIGKRCSVNTYNFWQDLKEEFKKDFKIEKR